MAKYKRRIKLIKPSLQIRLTLVFVGLAAMALLLQFVLFSANLSHVALRLPNDGLVMVDEMASLLIGTFVTAFVVFLPIVFAVGILATFRIAGPLYRFEMFLNEVMRGEKPRDCRIRKNDQLQDFCALLNEVTRPLREADQADASSTPDVDAIASLVAAAPGDTPDVAATSSATQGEKPPA